MQPNTVDDLLQFKDYSNTANMSSPPAQITVNSPTNSASSANAATGRVRGDPLADLIYDMSNVASGKMNTDSNAGGGGGGAGNDGGDATASNPNASFLTLEYYQRFFNVDAYMVLERIANAMIPKRAPSNYLRENISQNPDLYGPFWIALTLIFSIAISGNIADYVMHQNSHWRYNFQLVSYAATCVFIYVNFVPAALWAVFKYSVKPVEEGNEVENADYTPSLLSLMCIYGYSMSIYIPVSILWVIQISLFQWLLVGTGGFLSGIVLVIVLQPALRNSKFSFILVISILSAHFILAAGFMLFFFHIPSA